MTCHFCSSAATHRVVWAGGHGAIPVDERHINTARHVIERLNHDAVHDVQQLHGQQEANGFALDGEWMDPGHAGPLAVFCAAPLHKGPCKKIEGGPGHTLKELYQEAHGPKLAKIAGVDDVKKPHVPKPDLDEHAPKIDGGLADHGIGAPVKATYAEHGAPKEAIFHGVGVNARKIAKPVKLGMNAAGTHVMIHDKETGAHIGHIHAETPMWLAGTGAKPKAKPETVKLASGPGPRKAATGTARAGSGGAGQQGGRGGLHKPQNRNWPNNVPGNGFGGGLLGGRLLGGKKGPKGGGTGARGRTGTTAAQNAAKQLAALKAAGPQGLRTVPTAPNQLDVSMKNAAAAQNRLLLQHAQLQAQTLAEQLGKSKGHPAVQYYGSQLGKAYQAQAAYNRAVQAAQRQTASAEARNKAIMDAYAKRLAALKAQAAGQKAKAALQSSTTTGPTSSGTPVKVPASALPKVFQLDDAAEPLMHFELMRSPVEEYTIQQADAYALVASATYDQLDAMLAADHDFCDVGVFCRNPLHPGPCKGWKWALYGIAPEVYHHIERRRVAKINEKRAAKVAHLQSQGLKVPAHLLKEATYDPAKLKPHPESYAPPLPGDKGIAHIPSSHVIQANIGLKNAAKKIEQQKAMAHHVDQATKTISAASEAMGKPLGSGIGDQLHAQLTKAAQDLKPGESLSQHPKVAPTLKAMAGYASKHAGYGPAATEEIHKDLVHHIDTNQGSTPALVKSAMEVGDAKAKAAAEEKAQHEAAAAHPQLPLGHHGGPLNGAQTDPEIAKTIEANAGKGAGLVGVFPPSKIKTMKVPGNATTKIQFGHIDDKGTVYDKAGKVIGQHIESTGNGSEEHGWVHVQTTVPGTTEGTRKTVAVWKGVATGPKSGAAKKAAAAALKATEGKEAPGGEAKSAHSALLDKMEAHDWASATPAQVLNSRVALKKIIDHPDSTPEEKARAQALSQKITKGLGAKVEQQAKHEDLPGTKAAKMMDKIYSGPHAELTETDLNPPESELEPHEVDQLAKKAAKAAAHQKLKAQNEVAEPEGTHINPHTAQTLAAKKETFYPKEKIADPENLQAGHVVPIPNGGSTGHGWGQIMGPPTKKYGEMYVNVAEPGKGPHAVPVTQVKKDLAGYATATKEAGKAEPKGFTVTATAPTETVVKKLGGAAAETHQANTYTQLTALKKQAAEPEKLTAEGKAAALDQLKGIAEHEHSTDVQKKMATALANKINAHTAKQEADKAEAAHQAQLEADKHTALKANQAGAMHHMLASLGMANDSSEHNAMAHGIIGKAHEQLESKAVPGEKVTDHPVVKQAISKITNKVQAVLQDKAAKDGTGKSPGVDKVYPQVADALEHGHGELPPYVKEAMDHLQHPEASAATKKLHDAAQGGASPAVLAQAADHPHITAQDLDRLGGAAAQSEVKKAIDTAHGNTVEGTKEQKVLAKAHEKLFGSAPTTKAKPAGPTPEEHAKMDAQAHAIGTIGKALGLTAPSEQVTANAKKLMLEHHAKGLTPTDNPIIQKSIKTLGDQAVGKWAKIHGYTDVSDTSKNTIHSNIKNHILQGKSGLPTFVKTLQEQERDKAAGKPQPGSISLANAMAMPGVTPAMVVKHAAALSKEQHDLLPEAKQDIVKKKLDEAYQAGNKLAGDQLMKFGYPLPSEKQIAKAVDPQSQIDALLEHAAAVHALSNPDDAKALRQAWTKALVEGKKLDEIGSAKVVMNAITTKVMAHNPLLEPQDKDMAQGLIWSHVLQGKPGLNGLVINAKNAMPSDDHVAKAIAATDLGSTLAPHEKLQALGKLTAEEVKGLGVKKGAVAGTLAGIVSYHPNWAPTANALAEKLGLKAAVDVLAGPPGGTKLSPFDEAKALYQSKPGAHFVEQMGHVSKAEFDKLSPDARDHLLGKIDDMAADSSSDKIIAELGAIRDKLTGTQHELGEPKATGPLAHPDMMAVADLAKLAKQGHHVFTGEVVKALSKDGVTKEELDKLPESTKKDIAFMVDSADQGATGIDHAGLQAMWHQLGLSKYHDSAEPPKATVEQEAKDLTLGKPGMSYTDKMQHVDKAEWDKLSPGAKAWHQDVWKDLQADGGPSIKAKVQQIQDKLLGEPTSYAPHVKAAFEYGAKNKPGTGTMKLKAYERLSHGEYHSLPLAVQKQIKTDMEAGRAKFLDPKKIQSVDNKLAVWGEPEEVKGAPKGWGAIEATTSPMAEADGKIPKGTEHNVSGGTSKFSILPKDQRGQSGDGYYQGGGQWGKYGASGVMIRTMGDDGEWRYLMVQRGGVDADSSKTGKWQLAGGALEEKENAYQAAAREVQEELKADPHYLAGMQSHGEHIYTAPNGWKYTSIAATAPTKFNPLVDGHETADAKWFTAQELVKLDDEGHLIPELAKGALQKNIISLYGMPTAKPVATPKTVGSKLGTGTDISHLDSHTKQQIKNAYKSQTTGSSLNHSPESIYVNLLAIAHAYGTSKKKLSVMQVIRTIDELHYAQLDPGPENAHRLEDKITEWLKTPEGASFAKNAKPSPHVLSELKTEGNATLSIKPGETPVGSPAGGPGPFKKALTGDKFESVGHYQASKMMADGQANWTPEQIDALQAYTSSAHDMNSYLRTPGDPATAHTKKQAAAVQAAMRPIPKHVLLVRGTARSDALPAGFNTQASAHGLVGKTISDPGFLSTSVDHPFSGDLQLEIEAPAGTMGAYVEGITNVSGEYEMLLAAGTKLKVLSVTNDGMYGTRMRVRVVSTKSGKH